MTTLQLPDNPRLLIEAQLAPIQGTRFQPTGFPDLGAATYRLPGGTEMLLVESAQSVANRLEAVCWDEAAGAIIPELRGLPYVEIERGGKVVSSSLLEAHRLNSAYIEKSSAWETICAEIGYAKGQPVDRPRFLRALCKLDPCSLLHGVFLESIAGALRLPRALSGFIEARDVQVVATGGVKNDRIQPEKDEKSGATAKEGFGNVPFHRDEYSAGSITAYFNLDLAQIRSYGLGGEVERLLFGLALFKVQRFLERGLRLRTACDLTCRGIAVTQPAGYALPSAGALAELLPGLVAAAARAGRFAEPPVTRAVFSTDRGEKPADEPAKGKGAKGKGRS